MPHTVGCNRPQSRLYTAITRRLLLSLNKTSSHLRESAVVPDVALVGEGVGHEAELALLDVLLDGRQVVLGADLREKEGKSEG